MNRRIQCTAIILMLCLTIFAGCASKTNNDNMSQDRDTLYQVSTLYSLLVGNYDGIQTVGELKANGDIGIGTFHALDGTCDA